jgi:GntR family transcriptional regulator
MLPFDVRLAPGESPYRQIVYAATKAILSGVMAPGDAFPSVRELSQALKINPNTAQKVVAELVRDGLLAVHPGVGTIVERAPRGGADEKRRLLSDGVEQLVVEARRLGIGEDDLLAAVASRWTTLFGTHAASTPKRTPPSAGLTRR